MIRGRRGFVSVLKRLFSVNGLLVLVFAAFASDLICKIVQMAQSSCIAVGDSILILTAPAIGMFSVFIPAILRRTLRIKIPPAIIAICIAYIFGALYLGELRNFYYHITHWDTMLHTVCGAILGMVGFSLVGLFNGSAVNSRTIKPFFVAIFVFCFSITLGAFWEVFEFAVDVIFDANLQRYESLQTGQMFVGQAALLDTMKDLIVDTIGALTISIVVFASLKRNKKWLNRVQVEKIKAGLQYV